MENRIQQEINKTLQYMDNGIDIQASSDFAENLNNRISNIQISRGFGYRNHMHYSLLIIILIVLNLATVLMSFKKQVSLDNPADTQTSVLASEYGIGQTGLSNF